MDALLQIFIPLLFVGFIAGWILLKRRKKRELNKTDFEALGKKLGKKPWELKFEMGAELTIQDLKYLGLKGVITDAELVDELDKRVKTVDEILEALDVLYTVVRTSLDWQELDHQGKKEVLHKKLYAKICSNQAEWDYVMNLEKYDHWYYKPLLERWKADDDKERAKKGRLDKIKNPKTVNDALLFFDHFEEIPQTTDKEGLETELVRYLLKKKYDPSKLYGKLHYQKSKQLMVCSV